MSKAFHSSPACMRLCRGAVEHKNAAGWPLIQRRLVTSGGDAPFLPKSMHYEGVPRQEDEILALNWSMVLN